MAVRRIYVDKTELVLMVPTQKKVLRKSLIASDISGIKIEKKETKILGFIKSETESITISSGKLKDPIVYKKNQNKKFFDSYKKELEKFAKDNYLNFIEI